MVSVYLGYLMCGTLLEAGCRLAEIQGETLNVYEEKTLMHQLLVQTATLW